MNAFFSSQLSQLRVTPCLAGPTLNLLVTFICIADLIRMPYSMQIAVLHPRGDIAFESGHKEKISFLKPYLKGLSSTGETFYFIIRIAAAPEMCYMLYQKVWSGVRVV